jgi:hypothetical protein
MDDDFLNAFLNELISDSDLMRCCDLQNMINFCRETYDNWKEIKLEYSIQIKKDTELQFDVTRINLTENVLFLESHEDEKILTLKDLEQFLDDLRSSKEDWGDILIMCDHDIEIDGENNQFPISTFVDEEDFVFSFIL